MISCLRNLHQPLHNVRNDEIPSRMNPLGISRVMMNEHVIHSINLLRWEHSSHMSPDLHRSTCACCKLKAHVVQPNFPTAAREPNPCKGLNPEVFRCNSFYQM